MPASFQKKVGDDVAYIHRESYPEANAGQHFSHLFILLYVYFMLPPRQWVFSTSKCQPQSAALLLSLVYAEVKCFFLTIISLYSTLGRSIVPSLLFVAPSCEGCLGVWVFILWVISAVLKFTLRGADSGSRATPLPVWWMLGFQVCATMPGVAASSALILIASDCIFFFRVCTH